MHPYVLTYSRKRIYKPAQKIPENPQLTGTPGTQQNMENPYSKHKAICYFCSAVTVPLAWCEATEHSTGK